MIHHNLSEDTAFPVRDWRDTIAIGDIIRFPLGDTTDSLALVIDTEVIGGWKLLTLAPGIDDVSQPVRPGTLRLTRLDEVRQSGLTRAVRFELDRRISIDPNHALLNSAADPVVGHLCEAALDRLHAGRARLYALRDIATARRDERRAGRNGDRRTGWHPATGPAAAPAQENHV